MVKLIYFALMLFTTLASIVTNAATYRTSWMVAGDHGKACTAYLHGHAQVGRPLIVMLAGTGIYSTGDIVSGNPLVEALLSQQKANLLSLDKPGISYSAEAKNHFIISDEIYNSYTQRDLVLCAINAIKESSLRGISPQANIYFIGFSEGTQVSDRIYKYVMQSDHALLARIKALFLGGLVMEPWSTIVNRQITVPSEKAAFWQAYNSKDNKTLRNFGDLAYAYWADIFATESNSVTLQTIANFFPSARFNIYHGLQDKNTLVQPVFQFERWNNERRVNGLSSINTGFHYFPAPHQLNSDAISEISASLADTVK